MAAILKTEIEIIKLLGQSMACTIGKHIGEVCGGRTKRKLDEEASTSLQLFSIDELNDDFSHCFSTTQRKCDYVTLTESWMIKRNAIIDVSHGDTICWKHRQNYGCKFRIRSSKCMYPGHVETKRKPTVKPMSLPAVLQTERMFTSPAVKVILPFGAWCTNCMVRIDPPKWEEYSKQMGDVCKACYQDHSSATGYNHITLLYNIYLYTNIYTNFSFSF